jgi:hypothetical protein
VVRGAVEVGLGLRRVAVGLPEHLGRAVRAAGGELLLHDLVDRRVHVVHVRRAEALEDAVDADEVRL